MAGTCHQEVRCSSTSRRCTAPEHCPKGAGGSNSLFDADAAGVTLVGRYGANAEHTMFYVVEADDVNALQKFLWPGFTQVHEHDHARERGARPHRLTGSVGQAVSGNLTPVLAWQR